MNLYAWLADLIALVHLSYVLFVVLGQVLILAGWAAQWRWTRSMVFRYAHLGAIGFVVFEAWSGITCPLTLWENAFRVRAGLDPHELGFLATWVHRILFFDAPLWVFTLIYTLFFALVLLSLIAYPPRRGGA